MRVCDPCTHKTCTHREEEHAVHPKGGVTGVEGQPARVERVRWEFPFSVERAAFLLLPGLCDILRPPSAVDHLHVAWAHSGSAHRHEVRPRATDGELGQVGEWLTDGCSEQEGAHDFVEGSYVLVEIWIWVNSLAVDEIRLSGGNLRRDAASPGHVVTGDGWKRAAATYNDDRAADGDGRQHSMGDGVWLQGIHDALVVTVNPSLIRFEHDGHNDEGQSRCSQRREENVSDGHEGVNPAQDDGQWHNCPFFK